MILRGPAGGVIDVNDEAVDRFLAAGYTPVEPKTKAPTKAKRKGD